ncbi:MAG: hypothetical protein ACYS8K_09795, partial [Planctomycetota bacterium]
AMIVSEVPSESFFTVKLTSFNNSPVKRAAATELASQEHIRSIAGQHPFRLFALPDGKLALCVGRFADQQSPELHRILQEFRRYEVRGKRLFPQVVVLNISK